MTPPQRLGVPPPPRPMLVVGLRRRDTGDRLVPPAAPTPIAPPGSGRPQRRSLLSRRVGPRRVSRRRQGEWYNDTMEGRGLLKLVGGGSYDGFFRNGMAHGSGVYCGPAPDPQRCAAEVFTDAHCRNSHMSMNYGLWVPALGLLVVGCHVAACTPVYQCTPVLQV